MAKHCVVRLDNMSCLLYTSHDLRFQNYLAKNLDSDILELMPKTALELILIDGFNHYNKELHTNCLLYTSRCV